MVRGTGATSWAAPVLLSTPNPPRSLHSKPLRAAGRGCESIVVSVVNKICFVVNHQLVALI
jgi:hypothetical protein